MILKALELDENEAVSAAWHGLTGGTGLHECAHRDNLAPPRPLDDDSRDYFSLVETVFDIVLARFEERGDTSHPKNTVRPSSLLYQVCLDTYGDLTIAPFSPDAPRQED